MFDEVEGDYQQMMEKIAKSDDVDVAQLFREDRQPLKSPTMDKDKRRNERIEQEELYISVRRLYFILLDFILFIAGWFLL